jgi:chaperone required for assembly of F1-ATPase
MADWVAKRFWKETTVAATEDGFTVLLDGRNVRTPAKALLVVPSEALADEIRHEWDSQEEGVNPETMPYTRGANAAIDKVSVQHAEVADMLAAYGDCDLLCYRADSPHELVTRQAEAWDPVLKWVCERYDAPLDVRTGVIHAAQPVESAQNLSQQVHKLTNFELSAFHDLVALSGSLGLALAVAEGWKTPEAGWLLSRIDEDYQIEQWGEDEEASDLIAIKKDSFLRAAHFFQMVKR